MAKFCRHSMQNLTENICRELNQEYNRLLRPQTLPLFSCHKRGI